MGKMDVESFLDSVECLNLKSLKWSQFPPLPLALSETKPVYVQNKLFIVGGWLSQKTYSRDVYEFDSAKRAWRSRSAMPEECRGGGVVSFDDKLFVVGGDPKSCMHYDPRTDLWVQLQKPLFEHFCGPAAVWNDQIVVCGGAGLKIGNIAMWRQASRRIRLPTAQSHSEDMHTMLSGTSSSKLLPQKASSAMGHDICTNARTPLSSPWTGIQNSQTRMNLQNPCLSTEYFETSFSLAKYF
ncbi:hypothetical protein CAPTEDRAFT_185332 [Capitella teleta]|uniref:BACK domain-containing protein n=1 Tax=Capitella teleta TaxID=283909 RepID=R7TX46_CAPTE|nr:hypothetical protein CAPTEDRAFT_185332 [Capitella teleta]|eukprot:ELT98493.1 hypothetical protein CAPTEDRAFT_185332 [Capitella teleta]